MVSGDASQVLAGEWNGCNGPSLADLERKSMALLWPFIAVTGASPRRTSQCPRTESLDRRAKVVAEGKAGLSDYRREGDLPSNDTSVDNVRSGKLGVDGR